MQKLTKVLYSGLHAEMARHGHTQISLCEVLNLSQSAINQRFVGNRAWKQKEINTLCDYYKKSYEELFR